MPAPGGRIRQAADDLKPFGVKVDAVEADLSTIDGVDQVIDTIGERTVDALLANAGRGLGGAFVDQGFAEVLHVINTNITGTLYLIHKIARRMSYRGTGRILITGSIAGFIPGAYNAVYNASKAFLDSFSFALRAESPRREWGSSAMGAYRPPRVGVCTSIAYSHCCIRLKILWANVCTRLPPSALPGIQAHASAGVCSSGDFMKKLIANR